MLTLLLLAQTTPPAAQPAPVVITIDTSTFDLATVKPVTPGCGVGAGDDITVCARMTDLLPDIAELDRLFQPKPFHPEFDVAGGKAGVRAEQRSTLMGSAPALMFNFLKRF